MSPIGKRDMMERFGATLKNVRWSWDAVMGDGSIVFIGWEDQATRAPDGSLAEYRLVKSLQQPSRRPGASERIQHIQHLLTSNAAGYLALATAKDPTAETRQIASIDDQLYTVRIDQRGEAVFAVVVASSSALDARGDEDQAALAAISADGVLQPTEKQQLVNARRGQGLFRARVELIEKGCRLTGVVDRAHLRAGHIKPWRVATNAERLDGHNGLLLAPHADHLFDKGFITFDDDGTMLIASELAVEVLQAWGMATRTPAGGFTPEQREYLAYHRENIFRAPAQRGPTEGRNMTLIEEIAESLHDTWCIIRLEDGWVCGRDKSEILKTHPHIGSWRVVKSEEERAQDRHQAIRIASLLRLASGAATVETIADTIHEALKEFRLAERGELDAYLKGRWDASDRSRTERTRQASDIVRRFGDRIPPHRPDPDEVLAVTRLAIQDLFERDADLPSRVAERAVTHRLAVHLEARLRGLGQAWSVDCEYNRSGADDPKRLALLADEYATNASPPELVQDVSARTVFPDIIVHQRGTPGPNRVVIELKRRHESDDAIQRDRRKLMLYKRQFGYAHALLILLGASVGDTLVESVESVETEADYEGSVESG